MPENNIVSERAGVLKDLLRRNKLDGYIITNNLDQFYLTGFFFYPGESVFLVHDAGVTCLTRELYVVPFKAYAPEIDVISSDNKVTDAVAKARALGLKRVGFDAGKESYVSGGLFKASGFVEADSYLSVLRETKDARELAVLRDACRIAHQTYEHIKPLVKTGMSEFEVAAEMERFMRLKGSTTVSFYTIVAFGENAANPHHETSSRALKAEDAVLMDFGCIYKGYCSDITRSWWHGDNAPAEYTKIWTVTDKARRAGIAAAKAGVEARKVDAAARGIIADAGYGEFFTHGTGHGVGIEVHEDPYDNQTSTAILQEGNVITVEPGIYLPGKFGVRLEDTIAITQGEADILTRN